MNFLISVAADSVTLSATVGAVVADIVTNLSNKELKLNSGRILLPFAQNDKLRFHGFNRHLSRHFFRHLSERLRLR